MTNLPDFWVSPLSQNNSFSYDCIFFVPLIYSSQWEGLSDQSINKLLFSHPAVLRGKKEKTKRKDTSQTLIPDLCTSGRVLRKGSPCSNTQTIGLIGEVCPYFAQGHSQCTHTSAHKHTNLQFLNSSSIVSELSTSFSPAFTILQI